MLFRLKFNLYVHTTWKIQFHQSVNCFLSWVDDVDQAFVLMTGEDILTRFEITEGKIHSAVESLRKEIREEQSYLELIMKLVTSFSSYAVSTLPI